MKKKTIIFITIILLLSVVLIGYYLNNQNSGKHFSIISVSNINKDFTVKYEKLKDTKYYKIVVYDSDDSPVYIKETNSDVLEDTFDFINYKEEYLLTIFAYDENDNNIVVENPYTFTYNEPTFSKENSLIFTNNEDYVLRIDGDLKSKDYYISVNDGDYAIKKEKLVDNKYIISKELFTGLEEVLRVKIFNGTSEIGYLDIYSNISPVSDIKIISPNSETIDYKDIELVFEGGENATKYVLQIFNNTTNKQIKEIQISNKDVMISKDFFKKGESYTVTVKGIYEEYSKYTKKSEIKFNIDNKDIIKAPYISNIVSTNNSYIEIKNPNSKGTIYYTVNGEDPVENGLKYEDKILISDKTQIKAIVKDKNNNTSSVVTFDMDNTPKEKYNIYLSAYSNNSQDGVYELAKLIKEKLEKQNVNVYLNEKLEKVSSRIKKTNELDLDLYLGIYTNSENAEVYGIETWTNKEVDSSYSLAYLLQESIMKTYYDQKANHGLKYANDKIDELSKVKSPLNIRVVLGNLGNEDDANWFDTKYEGISTNISETILKYFAII